MENFGIMTAIGKKLGSESQNKANTLLQFISNGKINRKKYNFHFDFTPDCNNELLNNKIEQKKLSKHLRKKLSIELNIPEEEIILTNSQMGSYENQVILF